MGWLRGAWDRLLGDWWRRILAEHDTEPAELSGGLLKVGIGFWLLLPMDTFGSSPTFAALSILPEPVWGVVLIALGTFHLSALRSGASAARRHAATIGYLVWFSFAVVFVATSPPAIGWVAFLVAGLAQLWCSLRLGRCG